MKEKSTFARTLLKKVGFAKTQGNACGSSGTADKGEGRGDGFPVPFKSRVGATDPNRLDSRAQAQSELNLPLVFIHAKGLIIPMIVLVLRLAFNLPAKDCY